MPESDNARLVIERGLAWAGIFEWQKALHEFERAVSIAPTLAEGYRHRGVAMHKLGRDEEGLRDLDQAVRLTQTDPGTLTDRGFVRMRNWYEWMPADVLGGAVRDISTALDIDPDYTPALLARLLAGRKLAALHTEFTQDLGHVPAVLVGRTDIEELLGRTDVADLMVWSLGVTRSWLGELLQKCPEQRWNGVMRWCDGLLDSDILVAVGAEAAARGCWADASWAYTEVVRLNRDDPAAHHALACVLADCPDPDPGHRRLSLAFDHSREACSLSQWKIDGYRHRLSRITELREAHARDKEFVEAGATNAEPPDVAHDTLGRLHRGAVTEPSTD